MFAVSTLGIVDTISCELICDFLGSRMEYQQLYNGHVNIPIGKSDFLNFSLEISFLSVACLKKRCYMLLFTEQQCVLHTIKLRLSKTTFR